MMTTRADQIAEAIAQTEQQYDAAPEPEKPAIEAILVELHQNLAPLVEAGAQPTV